MAISVLKCPACGGKLQVNSELTTFYCQYCGTKLINDGNKHVVVEKISRSIDEARIKEAEMDYKKTKINFVETLVLISIAVLMTFSFFLFAFIS